MRKKISVIGLGYVGLPLAYELSKKYPTVGFDIKKSRINELKNGVDITNEIKQSLLKNTIVNKIEYLKDNSNGLLITDNEIEIKGSEIFIITVPTPIDKQKHPDLSLLINATKTVAKYIKKDCIVIYESTVYPGATEEICVPILEEYSGLFYNKEFYVGYSPERINPGDKKRTITKILKVTSGSNKKAAKIIDELYKSIIKAGTYLAPSIKIAEAAKVIENSQRDINIAFINEVTKIFNKLNIDTKSVLEAAGTKWNFLDFKPGLVGGHCIGVDPYYLASKALEIGYDPKIILSGRKINDGMGAYVAKKIIQLMKLKKIYGKKSNILILGFTFKENCPDVRNTGVINLYNELINNDVDVDIYDNLANSDEVLFEYGINLINIIDKKYDCVILAVPHENFLKLDFQKFVKNNYIIYDLKGVLETNKNIFRL